MGKEAYELLEVWKPKSEQNNQKKSRSVVRRPSLNSSVKLHQAEEPREFQAEFKAFFIIHPNGRLRIGWDLGSMVCVVYDMIMIPMDLFKLEPSLFLKFMEWSLRSFWTLDMPMSAVTAVILNDGRIRYDLKFILIKYIKTWLALDVLIVGSDWLGYAASSGGLGILSRASRIFRIVRVVRLLRLFKLAKVMEAVTERIQSDAIRIFFSIIKLCMFIICFAHVTGCLWWGVGARDTDEVTWIDTFHYDNRTLGEKYLMSMHFSVSQLAGGMYEVRPQGALERFFAVALFIIAFMCAAMIVSILTSSITQIHIIRSNTSEKISTLRKYLKQNAISTNLALRIQRNAQHALSGDLSPDAVELLAIVSNPLRIELNFEIYSDALRNHFFFDDYVGFYPQVARRVCYKAVSMLLLSSGDVVFSEGETCTHMFFVCRGLFEYDFEGEVSAVEDGGHAAEAVLWTRWTHKGTLTAASDAKVAMLDAQRFQDIESSFTHNDFDPKKYAAYFVKKLNAHEDPSDLTKFPMQGMSMATKSDAKD